MVGKGLPVALRMITAQNNSVTAGIGLGQGGAIAAITGELQLIRVTGRGNMVQGAGGARGGAWQRHGR